LRREIKEKELAFRWFVLKKKADVQTINPQIRLY
jgi:hypothetical protein